jgi:hypothetical protein
MVKKTTLRKFGTIKEVKHYIEVYDPSLKRALITKRCIHLEDGNKHYSDKMRIFTKEEIKKRHMGKIKCIVKYKNDIELIKILRMYFS